MTGQTWDSIDAGKDRHEIGQTQDRKDTDRKSTRQYRHRIGQTWNRTNMGQDRETNRQTE